MTATPDQTRTLDAAYQPFPSFQEWLSRTSVESARWSALVQKLREARAAASTLTSRALEVAKRAAAFDTGAIENLYETDRGFTYSVAFETGAWELGLLERGEQVRPLFEAQMHAYDFVLDLATGSEPISEAAIRRLHEIVCAAQDTYQVQTAVGPQNQPLPKGIYKALPNHVRTRTSEDHSYAPVDLTPAEMHRLVQELRTDDFTAAHPIQQAAYAHYCFVAIHPFADGNGRVARALASLYTYRAASAPIIILSEDKPRYLDALAAADLGNDQIFVDFLLDQAINTMDLIDDALQESSAPSYRAALKAFNEGYLTANGFTPEKVDQLGMTFYALFSQRLEALLINQAFECNFMKLSLPAPTPPGGFREIQFAQTPSIVINLSVKKPNPVTIQRRLFLYVPQGSDVDEEVRLISDQDKIEAAASLKDLERSNGFFVIRLQRKAEKVAAEIISELQRKSGRPH